MIATLDRPLRDRRHAALDIASDALARIRIATADPRSREAAEAALRKIDTLTYEPIDWQAELFPGHTIEDEVKAKHLAGGWPQGGDDAGW